MPRPRMRCRVGFRFNFDYFKPAGVPLNSLEEIVLAVEELEAVRLADLNEMGQEECAAKMGISQPTFHRIVTAARKKIADALANGKAIRVGGGNYKLLKR